MGKKTFQEQIRRKIFPTKTKAFHPESLYLCGAFALFLEI